MKKDKIDEDWRLIKVSKDLISHYEAWHFEGETVYMLARQTWQRFMTPCFRQNTLLKQDYPIPY